MGIKPKQFNLTDFHRFNQFLSLEIEELRSFIMKNKGLPQAHAYGAELEAWITSSDYQAIPKNEWLLNELRDEKFVPELSKFNIEYNSDVYNSDNMSLHAIEEELIRTEDAMTKSAKKMDAKVLLIGSLPNLQLEDFDIHTMTNKERYHTLNEQICQLDGGSLRKYSIKGNKDTLEFGSSNIMPVAATTSFQMHYQMPFDQVISSYNASLYASSLMTAVSANTGFLFGKELWDESRVPLFEQSIASNSGRPARVGMGHGYLRDDICNFFCQSQEEYDVIFPELDDYEPGSFLLNRLHNGTIWHWNRLIVDIDEQSNFQSRVEFRPCSAGPTPVDMAAHFALYLGLVEVFRKLDLPKLVSFNKIKKSFYNCAKDSLDAEIYNLFGVKQSASQWLGDELLDLAKEALVESGFRRDEVKYYLDEILRPRILSRRNGAKWQKQFCMLSSNDFSLMLQTYWDYQRSNVPLKDWKNAI